MSGDAKIFGGLLDVKARTDLRDMFAAQTLRSVLETATIRLHLELAAGELTTEEQLKKRLVMPHEAAVAAYEMADEMLAQRDRGDGYERWCRLAAIGELAVGDFLGTGDIGLIGEQLKRAIEVFVAEAKEADTLPAGPPDPPEAAAPSIRAPLTEGSEDAALSERAEVGAVASGESTGPAVLGICGAQAGLGEFCELPPHGQDVPHGHGSRVPGKMVGAGRGTKEGESK